MASSDWCTSVLGCKSDAVSNPPVCMKGAGVRLCCGRHRLSALVAPRVGSLMLGQKAGRRTNGCLLMTGALRSSMAHAAQQALEAAEQEMGEAKTALANGILHAATQVCWHEPLEPGFPWQR